MVRGEPVVCHRPIRDQTMNCRRPRHNDFSE